MIPRPGTGTIEITDTAVQINTPEGFDIKYTAATGIAGAYLVVELPEVHLGNPFLMPDFVNNDDTRLVELTLTDDKHPYPEADPHPNGKTKSSRYGRVQSLRVSHNSVDVVQTVTDNAIMWGPLTLPAKGTLTAKINNVRITDQTGTYLWTASLSFESQQQTRLQSWMLIIIR